MRECRAKIFPVVSVILMLAMVVSAVSVGTVRVQAKKKNDIPSQKTVNKWVRKIK